MFPASTHKGQAVLAFPDVCKTPTPGGPAPVPIPYPNTGMTKGKTKAGARKVKITGKAGTYKPVSMMQRGQVQGGADDASVLKGQLSALHQKIMRLPPGNTTKWHKALDDYVQTSAKFYVALSSDD